MRKVFAPPRLTASPLVSLGAALVMSLALFFILPLTQLLSPSGGRRMILQGVDVSLPPPPPPPPKPPPPPEEKRKEEQPELREPPRPLTLEQIAMALNPGIGGAMRGDFGLAFNLADALPDAMAEMKVFELSEVDRRPEPVYTPGPVEPIRLAREKLRTSATIEFILDERGTVRAAKLLRGSPHADWNRVCLEAVAKWRFNPAIKNGEAVSVRCIQPLDYEPPR